MTDYKTLLKNPHYLEPFFVGLFEGDGSLYLGRTKGGGLSYGRYQIRLKHLPENVIMLQALCDHFGGSLYYEPSKPNHKVVWVAVSQKSSKQIQLVFETYPPLTSRKICQLNHLKKTLLDRSWDYHLATRDSKYEHQKQIIQGAKHHFVIPHYFGPWLSGFMEAEGCFRSSASAGLSVYVSQNDDWYILNAIKTYWKSHHKLGVNKDIRSKATQYRLSISGKPVLKGVLEHFETYPLLGHKRLSYEVFCQRFYKKKTKKS